MPTIKAISELPPPPTETRAADAKLPAAVTYDATLQRMSIADAQRALGNLQILLRHERLYDKSHQQRAKNLERAYDALCAASTRMRFEVRCEQNGIIAPKISADRLPDARGELQTLAGLLMQAGIKRIAFTNKLLPTELDVLSELVKVSLVSPDGILEKKPAKRVDRAAPNKDEWWNARFAEQGVKGILINTQLDRKVDTILTSLIAALVAYGGNASRNPEERIPLPGFAELSSTLELLARITLPLAPERGLSPEDAARAIHSAMEEAKFETVRQLLSAVTHYSPEEGELPQPYIQRLSESLAFEQLHADFASGALAVVDVRAAFDRVGQLIRTAGKFSDQQGNENYSALAATWSTEQYRDQLVTRFWMELAPREKSFVLRGADLWVVPVVALRQTLGALAGAGADAPRREARHIVLNYARRLEDADLQVRRTVASGLNEMWPIIESLWPNQLPEDLARGALVALQAERNPQTAAALATFIESLGKVAAMRSDYSGLESMLEALEHAPRDKELTPLGGLTKRLLAHDRWIVLVDAALANRALDPMLPKLLERDPDRMLDRLTQLSGEPRGADMLPAMARLIRIIGVPALSVLETRLYEARPARVSAAIKLLAATDPDRLLRGFSRAIASWDWSMQDLAVSELARPANTPTAGTAAFIFSSVLANAHPLVVPMMIDQIGLAGEASAIPQLMEIASGSHSALRDQYVRIKSIEALGRLRALEAIEMLQTVASRRDGVTFAEPTGVRAAAQDALALIQDRPVSASVRATFDAPAPNSNLYHVPRRYMRVPLESPLRAQVGTASGGAQPSPVRVKTISLGGAYLESPNNLSVGDSLQLEVRSGLRKIHCTAVVRNTAPGGGGVEFVHMKEKDRDKLRKLVISNLPF